MSRNTSRCSTEEVLGPLAASVVAALDTRATPYWVDSGSLLGLVRDGAVPPWDKDIDLGIWSTGVGAARDALRSVARQVCGSSLTERRIAGRTYAFILRPSARQKRDVRPVSVHVFDLRGSAATSPQPHLMIANRARFARSDLGLDPTSSRRVRLRRLLAGAVTKPRQTICVLTAAIHLHRPIAFLINRRPPGRTGGPAVTHPCERTLTSVFFARFYWSIPAHHFTSLTAIEIGGTSYPSPSEPEAYLARRYGPDWRTPRRDWFYVLDDGCLYRE